MKELSKFELAAVKRTAASVKPLLNKVKKLEEKKVALEQEISQIHTLINQWEAPVLTMTGGFTSSQVLNGEMDSFVATAEETISCDIVTEENIEEVTTEEIPMVATNDFNPMEL